MSTSSAWCTDSTGFFFEKFGKIFEYLNDTSEFIIHSGTVSGNINDDNSLALTVGTVIDNRNWYELNYGYKVLQIYSYLELTIAYIQSILFLLYYRLHF